MLNYLRILRLGGRFKERWSCLMEAVDEMSAELLERSHAFFHVALLPLLLWIIC